MFSLDTLMIDTVKAFSSFGTFHATMWGIHCDYTGVFIVFLPCLQFLTQQNFHFS